MVTQLKENTLTDAIRIGNLMTKHGSDDFYYLYFGLVSIIGPDLLRLLEIMEKEQWIEYRTDIVNYLSLALVLEKEGRINSRQPNIDATLQEQGWYIALNGLAIRFNEEVKVLS